MIFLFTFDYSSQWMDGFYQVIAFTEKEARELLKKSSATTEHMKFVSNFTLHEETLLTPHVVYIREIENPNYEG